MNQYVALFLVSGLLGFVVVYGGLLIRHEIRTRRALRPADQLEVARDAGRNDVLTGWMRWARNNPEPHPYQWDVMPFGEKLRILRLANRRVDEFDAVAAMVSDQWRLHEDGDVRNAYLVGAEEAGREITGLCLGIYAGQEESARQGRKIAADVHAVRELDPDAGRLKWERDFEG